MGNFEGSRGVGAGKTVWEDGVWDAHKFDVDNADTSLKDKSRYTLLFEASRELGKAESTARREATELFYFKRADRRCLKQSCWADCREGALDCKGLAWPGTVELSLEESGTARGFFCWAGPLGRPGSGGVWTPLSIANSLFTLVELVDNASGRERCTVTTCAGMAEPKNWQKAIKMVVQEVRRWKNLCVTKCELIYYMGAPLKDMKHLAATLYILEMMNGNFLEEEMEFCNLDCLETIIAARKSGSKNEFSLILLRTSPSSLHFQQVFLKDIDNQGSTYIIGPAREPWDFTMEGKDQWYAVVILVVDEAQLHFDEENDTYKDLQMRRCCPPLLYGRTIWLMVLVINANIVQDSFVLSYNISFELSLVDRLKLGSLVHLQTHVLLKVLIRWLLTWIDKICDLIVIEGV
ncbi:hypothetical protein V6N13_129847 [Hibiscus sabdariffa]